MQNVELYTKQTCPYCIYAKRLLDGKAVPYTEIKIDIEPQRRAEMIERSEGRWTVPQIFIADKPIGGYDNLSHLERLGKLDELLTPSVI